VILIFFNVLGGLRQNTIGAFEIISPNRWGLGLKEYGSGTGIQILIVAEGVEDVGIIVLLVVLELVCGHELASLLDDVTLDTSLVEDDVLVWFPVDLVVLLLNLYYSIGNK
jgi:hypothetical protein